MNLSGVGSPSNMSFKAIYYHKGSLKSFEYKENGISLPFEDDSFIRVLIPLSGDYDNGEIAFLTKKDACRYFNKTMKLEIPSELADKSQAEANEIMSSNKKKYNKSENELKRCINKAVLSMKSKLPVWIKTNAEYWEDLKNKKGTDERGLPFDMYGKKTVKLDPETFEPVE